MEISKNSEDSNSKIRTKGFHFVNLWKETVIVKPEDIRDVNLGVNLWKEPIVEVKTMVFPKWLKPLVSFFIFLKEKLWKK